MTNTCSPHSFGTTVRAVMDSGGVHAASNRGQLRLERTGRLATTTGHARNGPSVERLRMNLTPRHRESLEWDAATSSRGLCFKIRPLRLHAAVTAGRTPDIRAVEARRRAMPRLRRAAASQASSTAASISALAEGRRDDLRTLRRPHVQGRGSDFCSKRTERCQRGRRVADVSAHTKSAAPPGIRAVGSRGTMFD